MVGGSTRLLAGVRGHSLIACLVGVRVGEVEGLVSRVKAAAGRVGVEVQLFDGGRVAGRRHIELALGNAHEASRRRYGLAKSLGMETLLYASTQRQISKALSLVGVNPQTSRLVVVVIGRDRAKREEGLRTVEGLVGGVRRDELLEDVGGEELGGLMNLYGVSEEELEATRMPGQSRAEAFTNLMAERMALQALTS